MNGTRPTQSRLVPGHNMLSPTTDNNGCSPNLDYTDQHDLTQYWCHMAVTIARLVWVRFGMQGKSMIGPGNVKKESKPQATWYKCRPNSQDQLQSLCETDHVGLVHILNRQDKLPIWENLWQGGSSKNTKQLINFSVPSLMLNTCATL